MRYHLGIAYIETKQFVLAIDALAELIKIDDQFWDAYYQLGKIYFGEGNREAANDIFGLLLDKKPDYKNRDEIETIIRG